MFLPQNIFTRVRHVGISISPYALRGIVVDSSAKITNQAEINSDELLISGETVNISKLTELLKQLKQQLKVDEIYAACCFPEKFAYSREHSLPSISNQEISEAINWQIGTIFPFNPDDIYTDWKLVERNPDSTRIVICAAHKKLIDGLVASCNAAGIKPLSFESSASALSRALTDVNSNAIIVEIDNFGSSITLVEKGISSLTATTNFSSAQSADQLLGDIGTAIKQLQQRISDSASCPIFITGEKAVTEIIDGISQKVGAQINLLGSALIPPSFQGAYIQSISTIEAPESDKTINLLPKTIENLYIQETNIIQSQAMLKYGSLISLVGFFSTLILFIASFLLASRSVTMLANQPELPPPPEGVNISQYIQKSQKITQLKSVEYYPTEQIDQILSNIDPQSLQQLNYDAAKKTIKLSLVSLTRQQLIDLKSNLDASKLFGQVTIPLSALNTEEEDVAVVLTLTIAAKPL